MGIDLKATLHSIYQQGRWALPPARSEEHVLLQVHLSTITLDDSTDYYEWVVDGIKWKKYHTGVIYNRLKVHDTLVPWHSSVWNKGGIPKHSFITWLFVLDRCPTKARILSWGLTTSPNCLLCNNHLESRDHLLFDCPFSWSIWEPITRRCNLPSLGQALRSWSGSFLQIQQLQGTVISKKLTRLAWQSVIYFVWQERNHRLHRNQFRPATSILSMIDATICNRASSLRSVNTRTASQLLQLWLSTST
ncbi:hypothetical protein V5N11_007693 [Cardamine amara subsp. amara]|uniref:Reverse transcriptase zinc-binding domain-containing protein n=1 Tax=Cardamine amara subsp. amara TaxID=228776 RepID=A0ABD0ZYB0_CARAN